MYRIAKQDFYGITQDQLCRARPLLLLQQPLAQLNITLPDQIRFHYPDVHGHLRLVEMNVEVIGENAHGICFLSGVRRVPDARATRAAHTGASVADATDAENAANTAMQTDSFQMNIIRGAVVRISNSERMSLASWERRVRRRFATAWKTDALPLSTMLIGANKNVTDFPC
jgi:hypothetical protein